MSTTATNPSFQWQTNLGLGFQNISNAGQYSGATTETLTVSNLSITNNNQVFRCAVGDGLCSDTTAEATLTIIDDAGINELNPIPFKKLNRITDLSGKETLFRKNTVLLFIYEDGTVERVIEME